MIVVRLPTEAQRAKVVIKMNETPTIHRGGVTGCEYMVLFPAVAQIAWWWPVGTVCFV